MDKHILHGTFIPEEFMNGNDSINKHPFDQTFSGVNFAVTVADEEGIIVWMNRKAEETFDPNGTRNLIGKSLKDCHKPESWNTIVRLGDEHETNAYTIEKKGVKKLVYQTPWYKTDGEFGGLVEISLPIPFEMPHFIRQ